MTLRVAVTGVSGDAGLGAVKGLRARGDVGEDIWILGFDACGDCAGRHLVDAYRQLPAVAAPDYVDALIGKLRLHEIEVLLPCIDSEILVLSRALRQLASCPTAVALAPPLLVEAADDKLATAAFLAERGIGVPPTCDADEPVGLAFPLIAKPRRGHGSQGIVSLQNEAEYSAFRRERRADYCLQRQINGPEITIGLLYDRDGVLRDAIAMERTLHLGRTVCASVVNSMAISALIDRFANCVPGAGSVNAQIRLDPEHGPLVFEVNARLSGSTAMRVAVGFNDPLRLGRHYGRGEPISRATVRPGTVYGYFSELVVWQ